jgi:hypothetical protein
MQKRASLNEKFNGLAAAIFTKQANASASLKNALNTPMGGLLAGVGLTGGVGGGLGLRAMNNLSNSLRGEMAALGAQGAKQYDDVSSNLLKLVKANDDAVARDALIADKYNLVKQYRQAAKDIQAQLEERAELVKKYPNHDLVKSLKSQFNSLSDQGEVPLNELKDLLKLPY